MCIKSSENIEYHILWLNERKPVIFSKDIFSNFVYDLASRLQSPFHRRSVTSLSHFYKYFNGTCSHVLSYLLVTDLSSMLHWQLYLFILPLNLLYRKFYARSFFTLNSRWWKSLPASCFSVKLDLQSFKSDANPYLLFP